jgi:hypothetical protein
MGTIPLNVATQIKVIVLKQTCPTKHRNFFECKFDLTRLINLLIKVVCLIILISWVMLTSTFGALVKEPKEETFALKVSLFTLFKS